MPSTAIDRAISSRSNMMLISFTSLVIAGFSYVAFFGSLPDYKFDAAVIKSKMTSISNGSTPEHKESRDEKELDATKTEDFKDYKDLKNIDLVASTESLDVPESDAGSIDIIEESAKDVEMEMNKEARTNDETSEDDTNANKAKRNSKSKKRKQHKKKNSK
ncbi:hypothetical protein V1511DRAFT_532542 [Dipodascopsis uninucleata]